MNAKFRPYVERIMSVLSLVPQMIVLFCKNKTNRESILGSGGVVVSLTSYSTRIRFVYLAIESIGQGSIRPRRMILWVDDSSVFESMPRSLQRLRKRGLEILPTEKYGPHCKYFPYVDAEKTFDLPLVTADDDIIYPLRWLENLLTNFRSHPNDISCFRAHKMLMNGEAIAPYDHWLPCSGQDASYMNFGTGVSGVLYPPAYLYRLKDEGDLFLQLSPRADDVWLHSVALRHGFKTRQINDKSSVFPVIPGTQTLALSKDNVGNHANDSQIALAYGEAEKAVLLADSI